ncbi:GNAT family N-acetyltransferase [Gordonia sp. HY002]|uniref:GNAT family N-acetyltransferase n=1 Tax=Gordonia zhenghanii TaxID=2911516 RepID=UPI001EEF7F13|nr:GNAT family N-acetyltransferase [Gordonia zhenghanii]MCF8570075.1 GNAT family N-acetyltransferase [Gordonia zhenghanii]MCF8605194.1 GNAT family N-acetyltransferase [Gordonia zhenghanii]
MRAADASDASFLTEMLIEAAFWRADGPLGAVDDILHDPELAHYVAGWPRVGDRGVVAEDADTGASVGAAWLRYFTADDPGYGFVESDIPELAMGTVRHRRGQGIGGCLLQVLIESARSTAISTLSLSVEPDNNARRLYERFGFATVGQTGGSLTMLLSI